MATAPLKGDKQSCFAVLNTTQQMVDHEGHHGLCDLDE
jgi:hypothetical protein